MSFLTLGLNETCTHWAVTGVDGYNEPTFAAPVQLSCRWEGRVERVQTDEGVEVASRARIFLDTDISTGDYLAYGVVAGSDPRSISGAYRVLTTRKIPSLNGTEWERKVYL